MTAIESIFGRTPCLIGVVHLPALPGSPRWSGDMAPVIERAVRDARALESAGFDGVILENFGDSPFSRGFAGRGAVAGLAVAAAAAGREVALPLGINVLRNDAQSAVAVAAATGARFIRVNVHMGAAATDQGIIQGDARETLQAARESAPGLAIFADVFVKHARPLGNAGIEQAARELVERGSAAAVIVSGDATGAPVSVEEMARVRASIAGTPVIAGSGVTAGSVAGVLQSCDGIIVGSHIMEGGAAAHPIDRKRATDFVKAARGA